MGVLLNFRFILEWFGSVKGKAGLRFSYLMTRPA